MTKTQILTFLTGFKNSPKALSLSFSAKLYVNSPKEIENG
jgi:hypothetical protein